MADKYLDNPANAKLIDFLRSFGRDQSRHMSADPATVNDPYFTLGTHPDLVERLWAVLGRSLPVDCRWVLCGTPVLAHPGTGTAFGFAIGSLAYTLRLPARELALALAQGASQAHRYSNSLTLDLEQIGDDWVLGRWRDDEIEWCRAAFSYFGAESTLAL
jgi:hypothetical protein